MIEKSANGNFSENRNKPRSQSVRAASPGEILWRLVRPNLVATRERERESRILRKVVEILNNLSGASSP